MVGGLSRITQDCPPFMLVVGSPAEVKGLNAVGLQRHGVSADAQKHLKHAYQLLCRESLSTRQALERIQKEIPACDEVAALISFIQKSERGIVK
jgi:UDP-N-acetylglucosamine acyltransferase